MNTYDYDVFGAVRSATGSQANAFTFTGEQTDASTGLEYLRARYYDMGTGRFVSRDPVMASSGWIGHPFVYAENNAVNLVDPSGLEPEDDKPKPVPLPSAGTLDEKLQKCQEGWEKCRFDVAYDEMRRSGGRLSISAAADVCRDFLAMCRDAVHNRGGSGHFDTRGARARMRSIYATSQSIFGGITFRIPGTGSAGLKGSKEGPGFNQCP